MEDAQIIDLEFDEIIDPKLRYYFITTHTKIDEILLNHWLKAINEIPDEDEYKNVKSRLQDLIRTQMLHDVVVPPFNQFPPKDLLNMSNDINVTFEQIVAEKESRLKTVIDTLYKKRLEHDQMVGVFIGDLDDQCMIEYVPKGYTDKSKINEAKRKSFGRIYEEVFKKCPIKPRPGDVLVVNVSVGTHIDRLLLENWIKTVENATKADLSFRNTLVNLINLQLDQNIAVDPFIALSKVTKDGGLPPTNVQGLTKEEILSRIHKEKQTRLASVAENHFKSVLSKSKRKAIVLVTDFDINTMYKIISENLKEKDRDKLLYDIEIRDDMIIHSLNELAEREAGRKATEFKDEALGVLQQHFERQKKALIPELDVFTGTPRPFSAPARPKIAISGQDEPQITDFIDLTTPPTSPVKEPKTPERVPMLGDFLALEGSKTPILTPKPLHTRRRLEPDFAEHDVMNILDTTPPILIMGQTPLKPQKLDWWEKIVDTDEIMEPLRPISGATEKPVKSFMETASDWIKHATVHLSKQDTKAGHDLWADILAAPRASDPISEPIMPEGWESEEQEDELLIEGL